MKYTYFAFSAARGLKIGQSKDPVARVGQINCGSNEFSEVFAVPSEVLSEKQAHSWFEPYRSAGEFFTITIEDAREILSARGITTILDQKSLRKLTVKRGKGPYWKIKPVADEFGIPTKNLRDEVVDIGLAEWTKAKTRTSRSSAKKEAFEFLSGLCRSIADRQKDPSLRIAFSEIEIDLNQSAEKL